ncbi:MAG: acetyltransferase [Chitinophagaceae bacterium]|nr:acetyltransferase [Chitinophagaceae bacterium]
MIYNNKKICILGAGGFGREVLACLIDIIANSNLKIEDIACFMVNDEHYKENRIMGVEVIKQSNFDPLRYNVVVAIGDPSTRKKVVDDLPIQTTYTTVIHPRAIVSKWVEIGEGSIVTAGTILTCNIKIGKHSHLNLNTTIGHDCVMGDFFTTAPAANVSGNCHFGDCVYLGTNSAVRQGIKICDNVTIGMGGVVIKDISEEGVYIGNPVQRLVKRVN